MLDFGIVDAHLHVWDLGRMRYPWLDDIPFLNRSFSLEDYDLACKGVSVDKMVFVQCECETAQHLLEVEWVSLLAENEPRIKGIVSYAPLETGQIVENELQILSGNPLVKGIRRIIQFEPNMEFCLDRDFIAGVNLLPAFGFTFDVCINYRHNKNVLRFLEQCPNVQCIIDHIGKPNIKGGGLDPWRSEMRALAGLPNVYCKVSSIATEADHMNWTIDDVKPYVDCIFENFGFDRTVFAGDWPVSSQAAAYPICVSTLLELLKGVSKVNLHKFFRKNAEDFYRV
jgi:L-fuconolactonase